MLVEVKPAGEDGPAQWSIVEMQGNLISGEAKLESLDVGVLNYKDGKPVLTIGPHILEGELKKLNPPLLILQKSDGTLMTGDESEDPREADAGYFVAGIAHQKILFKDRPKLGLRSRA